MRPADSRTVTDPGTAKARIAADLRGHRLDADHWSGRPDLSILCAGEPVGTGIADLLYWICRTWARGSD